jgi:hypothetical protein
MIIPTHYLPSQSHSNQIKTLKPKWFAVQINTSEEQLVVDMIANQEQNLKELQIRILQKIHHIQHFNICNNAPVTTVSMALYRRHMALNVRDHINTATALLDQEPLELPDAFRFRHYHAMFTYFRGMVYREEIRLDKIIDDLQEYVQYTQDHGVPRPPIQPNPHLISYGLSDMMAEAISDSSTDDDDEDTPYASPSSPSESDEDDPGYTPTSPTHDD